MNRTHADRRRLVLERLEDRRVMSANAYIYGIADNNTIWEVDVAGRSSRAVFDAQPMIGTGNSNAFAYDNSRSQFFFIDPQNQLQFWDRGSTLAVLASHEDLGLTPTGNQPCNAAYHDDAYWYFTDGTNVLNKVSFTYTEGVPSVASRETFVVNDAPTLTNTFGDIAIDANTGVLYASNTNGAFYAVDLAAPTTGFTLIKPAVDESPGLQLSFDSDYSTLYGQSFTGGQWYTVDRATGENTPILGFTTIIKGINGLRDIGGSADMAVVEADLSITKTDGADTYVPGLPVTYTITVTNEGPTAVTGARVRDVLPEGTTFVSATGGATYDSASHAVRYTAGTLGVSGSASFTVTLLPAASLTGNLTNTAIVATPPGVIDKTLGNNTATDTDTPAPIADLSITKTDGSATYVPGRDVTYTITVTNAGPSAVTGATVSDVLPAGTTFVSATGGASYNAGTNTVSYTAGTLAVGGSTNFTITILPAASRTGNLANTAIVAPPTGTTDPTPGNNTASDIDTPAPIADLSIAKTDGSATYVPGRNVTYTITVTNAGPSAVTGATVSDVLPAGTTFVSATGGASYNAGTNTVSYTAGTLAVGGSTSFTITILPAASRTGNLANTAVVAPPTGTTDPTPGNNTASDIDTPAPIADLSIAKTDGSATYVPGRNVTYTITVTNAGPSAVTGATVSDVLPAGTTFVSATGGASYNAGTNTVSYTAGTLAVGGSTNFTITILPAASRTGNLANTAIVAPPTGTTDPTPGNNTASDIDTPAPIADLSIAKTDGSATYVPGRNVTYTITVTNAGPSAVTGATVSDVLPAGTTFVSATGGASYNAGTNTVSYTAGTLAVGGSTSFTITILAAASRTGNLTNTAIVAPPTGTTDPTPGNNTATDTDAPAPIADLSIAKTDGSATYVPGRNVTYTITVTNAGPSAVTGATVSDVLPAGTTFVSATGGASYNAGTNTVSYTAGTLAVGGSTNFTITILPAASRTGNLTNTATVAPPSGTVDPTPGNNTATDTDTPAPIADLAIAKTDNRTTYVPGRNVTYTITVTNAGPSAVTGATVSDVLPAGTTFVSATGGASYNAGTNTVSYTAGTLAVGGSTSFTITILPAASRTDNLANTAVVAPPTGTTDPTPGNNTATDTDTPTDRVDAVILAVSDVGCESTPIVTVIDAASGSVRTQFQVFENGFRGGMRAALGDLDNDGIEEIVAAPGPGRQGEIRVFTLEGVERTSFRLTPFGSGYRDGIEVAVGDINNDGLDDVVAARSRGAGEVAVMASTGLAIRTTATFSAFSPGYLGGATVAVADMGTFVGGTDRTRSDGRAEVIVGSGIGMAPTVVVFDVSGSPRVVDSFRPLSAAYQAGFSLSAQRINADQIPDLVVSAGRSSAAAVQVYDGVTKARIATYRAFESLARASAQVYAVAADIDGDGWADEAYMTQGTGVTTAGVQRLRLQTPAQTNAIAPSLRAPLRVVVRGPRRLAG